MEAGEHRGFSSLQPGELFLFKLHAPNNFIVGGGHFVKFSRLPISLTWLALGEKNGLGSLAELRNRIRKYRKADSGPDPSIGNIVLSQPFWVPCEAWIPAPADWPRGTMEGKTYDALESRGYELWKQIQERLLQSPPPSSVADSAHYRRAETNVRLGLGGFRVVVSDAYERRSRLREKAPSRYSRTLASDPTLRKEPTTYKTVSCSAPTCTSCATAA